MLAHRIIPCLDVRQGRVVKGVKFVDIVDAGDPADCAAAYDAQGADELVFLDITASHERRGIVGSLVERVARVLSIPFTVGGGIAEIDEIRDILRAGADKVSLNSSVLKRPALIEEAAGRFGCQCIVVAIDARRKQDGTYEVFKNGGRIPTGRDVVAWAREAERLGAGEILLTSMDRDGTRDGYEIELTRRISEAVGIPVIASGGCGSADHVAEVLQRGGASAALAASIFHFGVLSVPQLKNYLAGKHIPVRPVSATEAGPLRAEA
ncbi:MAG: imidazole glycerol phosphate synthase subunit HisF [Acidobacteriota bacterium]